jgi:SAM-dependent methyltransferase
MYQGEILNPEGLGALYETWIGAEGSFQKRHQGSLGDKIGYARQAMQIIKACKLPPHEVRVLDFGMGWGNWLLMARAWGMQAAGLELSSERQAYARAQGLEVLSAIPPESFHFINAEQVFEHLAEPYQVLSNCAAGLKPGGFLRIAVPDGRETRRKLGAATWGLGDMPSIPLEHINIFTPSSLQTFAARAGLVPLPPPLVLPAFSGQWGEVRQVIGVAGQHLGLKWGLFSNTIQWFGKVNA